MGVRDAEQRSARAGERSGGIALTRAAATTPLLVVGVLAVCLTVCEFLARSSFVRGRLLTPSVGNASFDVQLANLNAFVERNGRVDCIFLGSSGVRHGIDPEAFDVAYRQQSQRPMRSFNFGLGGATASDVGAVARVLATDYHPRMLVYVTGFRDFQSSARGPQLHTLPWLRYRSGIFDLDGWLTQNSHAYRYVLSLESAYHSATDPSMRRLTALLGKSGVDTHSAESNGFAPTTAVADYRVNMERTQALLTAQFARPGIPAAHVAGLRELLALHRQGTTLLVVELPGPLLFSKWLQDNPTYRNIVDRIAEETRGQEIPFWRTWDVVPGTLIPDEGWADIVHPNHRGAKILGRWLGKRIARAEQMPSEATAEYF